MILNLDANLLFPLSKRMPANFSTESLACDALDDFTVRLWNGSKCYHVASWLSLLSSFEIVIPTQVWRVRPVILVHGRTTWSAHVVQLLIPRSCVQNHERDFTNVVCIRLRWTECWRISRLEDIRAIQRLKRTCVQRGRIIVRLRKTHSRRVITVRTMCE